MPQNPLEVVEVAASPQIINRKRMTKSVKTTAHAGNSELPAPDLEITMKTPLSRLRAAARAKDPRELVFGKLPIKNLAALNAHWYESLFVSLAVDPKSQVVKVHIRAQQVQKLLYAKPGVQRRKGKRLHPQLVTPDGLSVDYAPALFRRKRR